jgi:hypothetical protein
MDESKALAGQCHCGEIAVMIFTRRASMSDIPFTPAPWVPTGLACSTGCSLAEHQRATSGTGPSVWGVDPTPPVPHVA